MKRIFARVNTGHKTFDKQCECLSIGNVSGTCQKSSYVRPYSELECNGITNAPGHLQDFDLKTFPDLPERVKEYVKAQKKSVILYELRHWGAKNAYGEPQKVLHGYLITDSNHKHLHTFMMNNSQKSWDIMNYCKEYLTE